MNVREKVTKEEKKLEKGNIFRVLHSSVTVNKIKITQSDSCDFFDGNYKNSKYCTLHQYLLLKFYLIEVAKRCKINDHFICINFFDGIWTLSSKACLSLVYPSRTCITDSARNYRYYCIQKNKVETEEVFVDFVEKRFNKVQ